VGWGIEYKGNTMTTPLIILLLMIFPWAVNRTVQAWTKSKLDARTTAAWGLGLVFLFTSLGHFVQTQAMVLMLPAWVPARLPLVYLTGILELVIALGFFIPRWRVLAAWVAVIVLVLFFPANIYAAFAYVPMGGHAWGPVYLLIRAPLQLAIIAWAYFWLIKTARQQVLT
jgi:uncharacterized membrane protein